MVDARGPSARKDWATYRFTVLHLLRLEGAAAWEQPAMRQIADQLEWTLAELQEQARRDRDHWQGTSRRPLP